MHISRMCTGRSATSAAARRGKQARPDAALYFSRLTSETIELARIDAKHRTRLLEPGITIPVRPELPHEHIRQRYVHVRSLLR
jgi:hypothetical protein